MQVAEVLSAKNCEFQLQRVPGDINQIAGDLKKARFDVLVKILLSRWKASMLWRILRTPVSRSNGNELQAPTKSGIPARK